MRSWRSGTAVANKQIFQVQVSWLGAQHLAACTAWGDEANIAALGVCLGRVWMLFCLRHVWDCGGVLPITGGWQDACRGDCQLRSLGTKNAGRAKLTEVLTEVLATHKCNS